MKLEKDKSEAKLNTVLLKKGVKSREQKLSGDRPFPHMREIDGKMVIAMPEEHPQVLVNIQVDIPQYQEHGL